MSPARETYQIFLRSSSSSSSPPFFSSKLLSMRRRQKPEEKDGGEKRRGGEERRGGLGMHRCVYRPFQIGRLGYGGGYLEKKHEMIDDRPILVATYGVPYPPGCSYNGHRRNLFPQAGDVTSPMSFQSKFLLNDSQV